MSLRPRDAGQPKKSVTVSIEGARTENSVTRYSISVTVVDDANTPSRLQWSLRRRFSEFLALHSSLRRVFNDKQLPTHPPKKWKRRFDHDFIEDRKQLLQKYLVSLCEIPYIRNSIPFRSFLMIDKKTETPIAPTQIIRNYGSGNSRSRFRFYHMVVPDNNCNFVITACADRSSFGKKKKFSLLSACVPDHSGVLQVFKQANVDKFCQRMFSLQPNPQTPQPQQQPQQQPKTKHDKTCSQSSSESRGTTIKHSRVLSTDPEFPLSGAGSPNPKTLTPEVEARTTPPPDAPQPLMGRPAAKSAPHPLAKTPEPPDHVFSVRSKVASAVVQGQKSTTVETPVKILENKQPEQSKLTPSPKAPTLPRPKRLKSIDTLPTPYHPSCLAYYAPARQLFVGTARGDIHRYNVPKDLRLVASGALPSPHQRAIREMHIEGHILFVTCDGLLLSCLNLHNLTVIDTQDMEVPVRSIAIHEETIFLAYRKNFTPRKFQKQYLAPDKKGSRKSRRVKSLVPVLSKSEFLTPDLVDESKGDSGSCEDPKNAIRRRARNESRPFLPVMVGHMALDARGGRVFCCAGLAIKVWSIEPDKTKFLRTWKDPTNTIKEITSAVFIPEYRTLCVGGDSGYVNFFDMDGYCTFTYKAFTHPDPVLRLSWMADSLQMAVMTEERVVFLSIPPVLFNYRPKHIREQTTVNLPFFDTIRSKLKFGPDRSLLRNMSEGLSIDMGGPGYWSRQSMRRDEGEPEYLLSPSETRSRRHSRRLTSKRNKRHKRRKPENDSRASTDIRTTEEEGGTVASPGSVVSPIGWGLAKTRKHKPQSKSQGDIGLRPTRPLRHRSTQLSQAGARHMAHNSVLSCVTVSDTESSFGGEEFDLGRFSSARQSQARRSLMFDPSQLEYYQDENRGILHPPETVPAYDPDGPLALSSQEFAGARFLLSLVSPHSTTLPIEEGATSPGSSATTVRRIHTSTVEETPSLLAWSVGTHRSTNGRGGSSAGASTVIRQGSTCSTDSRVGSVTSPSLLVLSSAADEGGEGAFPLSPDGARETESEPSYPPVMPDLDSEPRKSKPEAEDKNGNENRVSDSFGTVGATPPTTRGRVKLNSVSPPSVDGRVTLNPEGHGRRKSKSVEPVSPRANSPVGGTRDESHGGTRDRDESHGEVEPFSSPQTPNSRGASPPDFADKLKTMGLEASPGGTLRFDSQFELQC